MKTSSSHPREKLSEFLDGTLDSAEREGVAAHLQSCAECAQIARELGNVRATLRQFPPTTAPASLRRNVRAALQNEIKAPAARPFFVWRPAQWVWTAPLALSALTLMILARPFSQSSLDPSSTPAAMPGELPASQSASSAPDSVLFSKQKPAGAKPQIQSPTMRARAVDPQKMKPRLPANDLARERATPPQTLDRNSKSSGINALPEVQPAPRRDAAPRNLSPRNLSPQPRTEPANPSSSTTSGSSTTAPERARTSQARTSEDFVLRQDGLASQSPQPTLRRSAPATAAPQQLEAIPARRPQTPRASGEVNESRNTAQPESQNGAPRQKFSRRTTNGDGIEARRDKASGLARALAPQFTFALQAVPSSSASSALRGNALEKREGTSAFSAPDSDAKLPMADSATSQEINPVGRARSSAGAVAGNPAPKSNLPGIAGDLSGGRLAARPNANFKTRAAMPMPGIARRFGLQIETPRAVKGAQVRLELPPTLQLLWPASKVIWRGDFAANTPVIIEFSLGKTRDEEKITVVVEQKTAGAQSRLAPTIPLQTQTLIVPASSDLLPN